MFSELVDDVVTRCGRLDKKTDIIAYANATLRECQSLALFWRDLYEDALTPVGTPFTWTTPLDFFRLKALKYTQIGYVDIYPERAPPGRIQKDKIYYYYFAQNYVVFNGLSFGTGSQLATIAIAYYRRMMGFAYYAVGARPAVFDMTTNTWISYFPPTVDPVQQEIQQNMVSNWLLLYWRELIAEGTLAKIYKVVGDPKAGSSFALYKSWQETLLRMESNEAFDELAR